MSSFERLEPYLQHYAWGGFSFLPQWLGIENPGHQPFAEAWFGAHPNHPSLILSDHERSSLKDRIEADPLNELGAESVSAYGPRLPFLLKILDVRDMLSIQLHPDKKGAEAGFEAENNRGIALNDPKRNYRDDNHKPEMLLALSDFWMLQGFAPLEHIRQRMSLYLPELEERTGTLDWKGLLELFLSLDQEMVNYSCSQMASRLSPVQTANKKDIGFWLGRAMETYPAVKGNYDRGLLVLLLLHIQYLRPGQAGYQAPGVLHAYLEGQNVELMSNSDNVLRGGLTPKHIDIREFLKHADTSRAGQHILKPDYLMDDELVFTPPVPDFLLKHFKLNPGASKTIQFNTASIVVIHSGRVGTPDGQVFGGGQALWLPCFYILKIKAMDNHVELFLATATV
jgi:mannose-6-phosphate isomerase